MFWNLERNFVFGDVREEESVLHIVSSGSDDDNRWLRDTLLKGMELEIEGTEDPLSERHAALQEQYSDSTEFQALVNYAKKHEDSISLGWNGEFYCYFSQVDHVCILQMWIPHISRKVIFHPIILLCR